MDWLGRGFWVKVRDRVRPSFLTLLPINFNPNYNSQTYKLSNPKQTFFSLNAALLSPSVIVIDDVVVVCRIRFKFRVLGLGLGLVLV